jgi:hypothetical protein
LRERERKSGGRIPLKFVKEIDMWEEQFLIIIIIIKLILLKIRVRMTRF